jgi:hypothetical protein
MEKELFAPLDRLIISLNMFFKYDVDQYPQLLDYLIENYIFKCRYNIVIAKKIAPPIMDDIKKSINNEALTDYLFTGDTTCLRPEDVFRSVQLLKMSTRYFEEEVFTSRVIAKGLAFLTTIEDIEEMLVYLKDKSLVVAYDDMVKASIKKNNITLLNYLVTDHEGGASLTESYKLECYKYIYDTSRLTCAFAVSQESLACLKYAYDSKEYENNWCYGDAVSPGGLDYLKYKYGGVDSDEEESTLTEATPTVPKKKGVFRVFRSFKMPKFCRS